MITLSPFWSDVLVQLVATVGALGVAVAVYLLTRNDQWAIFRGELESQRLMREEEERSNHEAIRAALRHEAADNLQRLQRFWPTIILPPEPESGEQQEAINAARNLVSTAVPIWSTAVWQGAASAVATALSQERLIATYQLYTILVDVLEAQRQLQLAQDRDTANYAAHPDRSLASLWRSEHFNGAAAIIMPSIDTRVKAVLEQGNPVAALDEPGPSPQAHISTQATGWSAWRRLMGG